MKKAIRRRGVPQEILSQLQLPLSELIRQTLLDTVITSGTIQAIEMLRSQQEALCGPRYKQVADRKAHRHGSTAGSLVMGGRRVTLPRPRVRSVAGREVELPAWTQWSREDPLEQRALQQMILGVSTRGYSDSLEKLPVEVPERGKSRSAVSRRFVEGTRRRLVKLQASRSVEVELGSADDRRDPLRGSRRAGGARLRKRREKARPGPVGRGDRKLPGLQSPARESRLTWSADEPKHAHRPRRGEGSAQGLQGRLRGPCLHPARCQEHKKRNVANHLPESMRPGVRRAMNSSLRMPRCEERKTAARSSRRASRVRASWRCRLLARRPRRDAHRHRAQPPRTASAVPADNESDRQPHRQRPQGLAAREALARRPHDASMVWCCSAGCRAALPPYQGLPRDAETDRCPQSTRCRT